MRFTSPLKPMIESWDEVYEPEEREDRIPG
jgi:hypothetical protein